MINNFIHLRSFPLDSPNAIIRTQKKTNMLAATVWKYLLSYIPIDNPGRDNYRLYDNMHKGEYAVPSLGECTMRAERGKRGWESRPKDKGD